MSEDELMDTSYPMEEDVSDSEEFNNKEEGDLTGDGGVQKTILQKGEGFKHPEKEDEVRVHYVGRLQDSEETFDNSYERGEPLKFQLGTGKVIKGWDIAVATMKKGEKAQVTIRQDYGYGESGMPPKIPANATLVFEMELVDWTSVKDMFGDGKAVKYVLAEGTGWERPLDQWEVFVNVMAKTTDGKVLWEETEFGFTIGRQQVPVVWEKAVRDMKRSAKVQISCKDEYVRGPGLPQEIPFDMNEIVYELELVRWNKVEDITKDGGVIKKIIREGEGWEKPSDETKAVVNMLVKEKDTSKIIEQEENFEIILGDGNVMEGIELALETMKKGEKALLTTAPRFAYQELSEQSGSLNGSTKGPLEVELELISFERAKESWNLSTEEKLENATRMKEKGNHLFKSGRYKLAKKKYEKIVNNLEFDVRNKSDFNAEQKQQGKTILLQAYLNLAACEEKFGNVNDVVKQCNKALELDSINVKALYRRAGAYLRMAEVLLAENDLKRALELDPNNVAVKKKMRELRQVKTEQDAKDRRLFGNMLSHLGKIDAEETKSKQPKKETKAEGITAQ
eukprot:jgi/Galph1/684/GphlegSOOS_G5420.1